MKPANNSRYRLEANILTQNLSCAYQVAEKLHLDLLWVNTHQNRWMAYAWDHIPDLKAAYASVTVCGTLSELKVLMLYS